MLHEILVCWCGISVWCMCSRLLSSAPQSDELSPRCPTESVTLQGFLSQHYIQVIFRPVNPSCLFSSLESWINLWHNLSLLSWESCVQLLNLMLLKLSKVKCGFGDRKKKKKQHLILTGDSGKIISNWKLPAFKGNAPCDLQKCSSLCLQGLI